MTANMHETNASLGDQTTGKPVSGTQQLGDLGHGKEPFHLGRRRPSHHATLPIAETPAASSARRLASSKAAFNRLRSATTYSSRRS
jgi:hypothetical protein